MAQDDSRVGEEIRHYRLTRLLGRGGMGVVYEAVHVEIGQRAAIKLLPLELRHQTGYRERFLREAQAASKAKHAGLVQVFDYGEHHDGTLFILMELLEGPTIREILERAPRRRLSFERALRIGEQVASAVAEAYRLGVVHCDLKPDNLKQVAEPAATGGSRVKVLDFGIAKLTDPRSPPTMHSIGTAGTPAYMAPERCDGERRPDGQSDVYSLGCILYELLSGRTPFVGEPRDLLNHHLYSDALPLRRRVQHLPFEVEALVMRMLAKEPAARPTMAQVAEELTQVLKQLEDPAQQATALSARLALRGRTDKVRQFTYRRALPFGLGMLIICAAFFWRFGTKSSSSLTPSIVKLEGGFFWMGASENELQLALAHMAEWKYPPNDAELVLARSTIQRAVWVRPFMLQTYEVTCHELARWLDEKERQGVMSVETRKVGDQQTQFVKMAGRELLNMYPDGRHDCVRYEMGRFIAVPGRERRPANSLTWDAANAYCKDHGLRLPTEVEWELAARGDGFSLYPWGNSRPRCEDLVVERNPQAYGRCTQLPHRLPDIGTGAGDRSPAGIFDLAGSVREWVQDCFQPQYPACSGGCRNPVVEHDENDPTACSRRVLRGSAWSGPFPHTLAVARSGEKPGTMAAYAGFRCAADWTRP